MPTYIQILDGNTKVFSSRDSPTLVSQTTFDQSTQQSISGGVQIDSWGLSANNTTQATGQQGSGKISIAALEISRPYDQWSPTLFKYLTSSKLLTQLTLVSTRSGGAGGQQVQSVYTFSNVIVSNQQWSSGGDAPSEALQFVFAKVSVAFQPQDASGKSGTVNQVGWDLNVQRNF